MTDPIKPATRADVERWKAIDSVIQEKLIATLESWEPIVKDMAEAPCRAPVKDEDGKWGSCGECEPCLADKLMEEWNA